ncbi:MAG: helix-turn-helix domain-containing protein [Lachnospiraceae bacterium]|nr:helix-turn-helix transcriptional regulator [Candidatus Methanomethylophilaceae archaeon]MDD3141512.1 helix-turn-helix domain-containing protein [Lachnospiraceae bacterium]MDY0224713.1 helix-turn-helix domain-containing protein [Candidatus Methanomethylophilaceae archaeon]
MIKDDNVPRIDSVIDIALSVIRGKWKTLILCKLADRDNMRFSQLLSELEPISARILSKQLGEMEQDKLIKKIDFEEIPPRIEYSISSQGKNLVPALRELADWAMMNKFDQISYEGVSDIRVFWSDKYKGSYEGHDQTP